MWRAFVLGGLLLPYSIYLAAILIGRWSLSAAHEIVLSTSPYILVCGALVTLVELPLVAIRTRHQPVSLRPYLISGMRAAGVASVICFSIHTLINGTPDLFAEIRHLPKGYRPPFNPAAFLIIAGPLGVLAAFAGAVTAYAYYWLSRWFVLPFLPNTP